MKLLSKNVQVEVEKFHVYFLHNIRTSTELYLYLPFFFIFVVDRVSLIIYCHMPNWIESILWYIDGKWV